MVDPIRVVLVDDAEEVREVVRLALERESDFTVVAEAGDGQSGIAAVSEHQPDLVILDFAMPDLDGLQVLTAIRHSSPASTVVIMTGYPETVVAAAAVELGAHGYVRKGVRMSEFLATVRDVLEERAGRRAHAHARDQVEDASKD